MGTYETGYKLTEIKGSQYVNKTFINRERSLQEKIKKI